MKILKLAAISATTIVISVVCLASIHFYNTVPIETDTTLTVPTLLQYTNDERSKAGLPALASNPKLDLSAQEKCNDIATRKYWSHDTPEGVKPWVVIHKYTDYFGAGENLAKEFVNSHQVIDGWMKSPTHRENMLNPDYDNVGYAICGTQPTIVVQHFIDSR